MNNEIWKIASFQAIWNITVMGRIEQCVFVWEGGGGEKEREREEESNVTVVHQYSSSRAGSSVLCCHSHPNYTEP